MCDAVLIALIMALPTIVFAFLSFFAPWSENAFEEYNMSPWGIGGVEPRNHFTFIYGFPDDNTLDLADRTVYCEWADKAIAASSNPKLSPDPWCDTRSDAAIAFAIITIFALSFSSYCCYMLFMKKWDRVKAYWPTVSSLFGAFTGMVGMSAWLGVQNEYVALYGVNTSDQGCLEMCLVESWGLILFTTAWVVGGVALGTLMWFIARQKNLVGVNLFTQAAKRGDLSSVLQVLAMKDDMDLGRLSADGRNALHWAAALNHLDLLVSLLRAGAPPDVRDSDGWGAIHWACRMGHVNVALALAESGADVNAKERQGQTGMMLAVVSNAIDVVETLVDKQANVDMRSLVGETALMYCGQMGKVRRRMCTVLINSGASMTVRNNQGETCLHYAASSDDGVMAEQMLALSPEPWFLYKLTDAYGATALDVARLQKKKHALRAMKKWEAEYREEMGWNVKKKGYMEGVEVEVPVLDGGIGNLMAMVRKKKEEEGEAEKAATTTRSDGDVVVDGDNNNGDGGGLGGESTGFSSTAATTTT